MADTVPITAGSGTTIGTDEVTIGGTAQHLQRMKLFDGTDGGTDPIPGTSARGLYVDPRPKATRIQASGLTISTSPAYTAKDAVGGLLTFANAVRASGGSCRLEAIQLVDRDQEMAPMDLILFDRNPVTAGTTTVTDNSVFDPVDADLSWVCGIVPISGGHYADFSDNAVGSVNGIGLEMVLNGTDLFGVLVARSTPTYTATTDLVLTATLLQD